jgi:hypothetical protein
MAKKNRGMGERERTSSKKILVYLLWKASVWGQQHNGQIPPEISAFV